VNPAKTKVLIWEISLTIHDSLA